MLILPTQFLAIRNMERSIVFYETIARVLVTISQNPEDDFQSQYRNQLEEIIKKEFDPQKEEIVKNAADGAINDFLKMLDDNYNGLRDTYEATLYSGTVWIWCSFEVLMKELWEYALNMGSGHTKNNIIKGLSSQEQFGDQIQGKYISLEYLAKYNYDISRNLGTVLKNKFDFTSCSGIRKAFSFAFPKNKDMEQILSKEELSELEATRNVIVHNAGIIDDAFCKRVVADATFLGQKLELSNRKVAEFSNNVIDIGLFIMQVVSDDIKNEKGDIPQIK
jgi:hypothetical protein